MTTKIAKWGNSLAIRVPRRFVEDYHLHEGTEVNLECEKDLFKVKPLQRKRITLKEIVDSIDPNDPPEYIDWGPPVGREIW